MTNIDPRTPPAAPVPNEAFTPRLVSDTLETRLVQAIATSRAAPSDSAGHDEAFMTACRRDAIAAIEIGRAIGLLRSGTPTLALCPYTSDGIAG